MSPLWIDGSYLDFLVCPRTWHFAVIDTTPPWSLQKPTIGWKRLAHAFWKLPKNQTRVIHSLYKPHTTINILCLYVYTIQIRKLIPPNFPSHSPLHESVSEWLNVYGSPNYRNTVFFKGPLLHNDFANACPLIFSVCKTVSLYKTHAKKFLLQKQACGIAQPNGTPKIVFWKWDHENSTEHKN